MPYTHHSLLSSALPTSVASLPLASQTDILSALPNYHWDTCPNAGSDTKYRSTSTGVGFDHFTAYQPVVRHETREHAITLPTSARNRFIYFMMKDQVRDCRNVLRYVFDPPSAESGGVSDEQPYAAPIGQPQAAVPRSRRYRNRVVKITAADLQSSLPKNMSLYKPAWCYEGFKNTVVEIGVFSWRIHSPFLDVIAMNDYSSGSGEMLPQSFVHVTRLSEEGETFYSCNCVTYSLLLSMGPSGLPDGDLLPDNVTCMHCRFFREEVEPRMDLIHLQRAVSDRSPVFLKLQNSLQSLGLGVLQLTTGSGTQKFSVRCQDGETCSLVNLTMPFIACQSGECQATGLKHRRSAKRLLSEGEGASLCPHLDTMLANREVWQPEWALMEEAEEMLATHTDLPNVEDRDLAAQVHKLTFKIK